MGSRYKSRRSSSSYSRSRRVKSLWSRIRMFVVVLVSTFSLALLITVVTGSLPNLVNRLTNRVIETSVDIKFDSMDEETKRDLQKRGVDLEQQKERVKDELTD